MKREEILITLEVLEKFMSKSLTKKERDSLDNVHTMITFYEYELCLYIVIICILHKVSN